MAQIFHPITNVISRVSIVGSVACLALLAWVWSVLLRSPYVTQADVVLDQPVPFSHKHHVSELGIDCRFCHFSVEEDAFAGMPTTQTCMTCHSQIHVESEMLAPVRESYQSGRPMKWNRVNDLPDFVFFNHSIHVNKGIGCESCHGPVNEMPLTWQHEAMLMEWCLECHRAPEEFIRSRAQVFDFNLADIQPVRSGMELVQAYGIQRSDHKLTNCSICHR